MDQFTNSKSKQTQIQFIRRFTGKCIHFTESTKRPKDEQLVSLPIFRSCQ